MRESPLLTIAMPTFNRLNTLREQISRLIQIQDIDVEILISDNSSTDGAREYLSQLKVEYPRLRILFNKTNMGFDSNILNLYSYAKGDFIWFLSNDDPINVNSVEYIVSTLRLNPDLGVLALAIGEGESKFARKYMVSYANYGPKLTIEKNSSVYVGESRELRTMAGTLVSQISTCITSRSYNSDLTFVGGGIAHVVLAQFNLIEKPLFMLLDSDAVSLGEKNEISTWFLDSCFNGVSFAYKNLEVMLGQENCLKVIDSTKTLGLKIAFSAIGSNKDHFDRSLLNEFSPPQNSDLKLVYFWWFILTKISLKYKIFATLLYRLIHSYQVISQKARIIKSGLKV